MSDPHAEIQLVVEWLRGAAGPLLPADGPAPDAPPATAGGERPAVLARLAAEVDACRRCGLGDQRTNTVFGEGSPTARLVVVGEAPGAEEDRTGRPFVGRAGELLTRMLAAIGLPREDVFICNVLKCRPPGNRAPRPDEAAACRPFLRAQLEVLDPPLLLALGAHAARLLLGTERGISALRGRFHTSPDGWRVMPTFHPAYLLRNPAAKREAWEDLQEVARALGLPIPPR
jgi:DNA polymerase